jgi:hypothetical protein
MRIVLVLIAAVSLVGLGVAGTVILSNTSEAVLPPGCAPADIDRPGCRAITRGVSTNTIALATVIASPLGAVLVTLLTVETAVRRQREQFAAERALQDLQESRLVLDGALAAAQESHAAVLARLQHARGDETVDEKRRAVILAGSRLVVRFQREHPVTLAFKNVTDALDDLAQVAREADGAGHRHRAKTASQAASVGIREFADQAFRVARVKNGT